MQVGTHHLYWVEELACQIETRNRIENRNQSNVIEDRKPMSYASMNADAESTTQTRGGTTCIARISSTRGRISTRGSFFPHFCCDHRSELVKLIIRLIPSQYILSQRRQCCRVLIRSTHDHDFQWHNINWVNAKMIHTFGKSWDLWRLSRPAVLIKFVPAV